MAADAKSLTLTPDTRHLPPMAILGIGTDIVECLRIAQMIERHGELFITRVYTAAEIEYCSARKAATQHYAGRWAAKEAVLKALGTGWRRGISLARHRDREQPPGCAARHPSRRRPRSARTRWHPRMHVSISHSRCYAVAYAIAEGEEREHLAAGLAPRSRCVTTLTPSSSTT